MNVSQRNTPAKVLSGYVKKVDLPHPQGVPFPGERAKNAFFMRNKTLYVFWMGDTLRLVFKACNFMFYRLFDNCMVKNRTWGT